MADLKLAFALAVVVLSVLALNVNGEYRFVNTKRTWAQAEADCRKWGGHLANVNSKAENSYIHAQIKARKMGYTWIGLNDIKCEGKWSAPVQYSNWNPQHREPNGKRKENCGMMYSSSGRWNDWGCHNRASSVCQVGAGKYIYNKGGKNFGDADNQCKKQGGRLACIETAAENSKILAELKKRRFGHTWIGFDDVSCEGSWMCRVKYSNWNRGEPNGKRGENCVMLYQHHDRWNDWGCGNKASYVCQKGEGLTSSSTTTTTTKYYTTTKVYYKYVPGDEEKATSEEPAEDVPQDEPEVEEAAEETQEE